jgi:hypothetical protein
MPSRKKRIPRTATEIDPDAILWTCDQTMRALAIGKTTLFALLKPGGPLESVKIGGARRIVAASAKRLAAAGAPRHQEAA